MTHREDGRLQETLIINGKRRYFYGKTKSEILKKIQNYKEKEERGKLFPDVAEEWWQEHETKIAYNTIKGYSPALERAIKAFDEVPIKSIQPNHIKAYLRKFARSHADKTVKTQLLVFNLIFRFAVEEGYILFNPARDIHAPTGLGRQKVSTPSPFDIEKIKTSTHCTFGMFAYWLLYTGMRRGELMALEWNDVDIKNRTITISKSLYYVSNSPRVKMPKTKTSIGKIPILDALLYKIKPKKHGLVFPNKNGQHLKESEFRTYWKQYCKESGVTCTPHQLRHAYATMLFEAGIPPEEAQALLRHAQISTTMDIYTDLREKKQKQIFEKVYGIDLVSK